MPDIEKTIGLIQGSTSAQAAFQEFNVFINAHGFNGAVYTFMTDYPSINQSALHGIATSYPEDWIKHYNSSNYQDYDPIWQRALSSGAPYYWQDVMKEIEFDSSLDIHKKQSAIRVMNEAAESGIADGIGMSFANRSGEISGLGISRIRREKYADRSVLAGIYLVASMFHEKYLSFFASDNHLRFTQRERDTLSWAAEGLSDIEIAHAMNITHATVRFHWKNIFFKAGVQNKTLAVVKAIRTGVIYPQRLRSG